VGASTSWNPQGLSRPVMGLLYLYLYTVDEMRREMHAGLWWGNLMEREHFEDISVDGWIMLKYILKG